MGEEGILLVVELVSGPGIKEYIGHVILRVVGHDVWSWVGDQGAIRREASYGGVVAGFQCVVGVAATAA